MPKRMREQVKRDREQAIAIAALCRVDRTESDVNADDLIEEEDDAPAMIGEPEMRGTPSARTSTSSPRPTPISTSMRSSRRCLDDTNPDAKPYVEAGIHRVQDCAGRIRCRLVRSRCRAPPPRASSAGFSLPDEATTSSAGPPAFAPQHRPVPAPRHLNP